MSIQPQPSRFHRAVEDLALLLNLAMKVAGLVLGVNLLLLEGRNDPVPLLYSALLVAGGEVSQTLILSIIDRIMGERRAEKPHEPTRID